MAKFPDVPKIPEMPKFDVPKIPEIPKLPSLPTFDIPKMPGIPTMPKIPSFGSASGTPSPKLPATSVSSPAPKKLTGAAGGGSRPARGSPSGTGRADPDVPFTFYVEIDGIQCAKFREATGLEWKADPESFNEGGNNTGQVHLIGRGSFTPLKLKKGFFASRGEFFDWMKSLMDGGSTPIKRASVSVVVQNCEGDEIGRFDLFGAFMTRYAGPGFNAMEGGNVAFEEIEIVYDRFEFKPGAGGGGALQSGMGGGKGGRY